MWEMCLIQNKKRKRKEEEEGPTLHQSPPGGGEPLTLVTGLRQECGFTRRASPPPWPSPKKGLLKCQSFLQRISKIKMQSHVVWGPWVTPSTQLFLSTCLCHLFSTYGGAEGEPVNAINQKRYISLPSEIT